MRLICRGKVVGGLQIILYMNLMDIQNLTESNGGRLLNLLQFVDEFSNEKDASYNNQGDKRMDQVGSVGGLDRWAQMSVCV